MANKGLFGALARRLPATDTVNRHGAPAYAYGPKAKLAQLAVTGTLSDTFYGSAVDHLKDAVYARKSGAMKDMPALLAAYLTVAEPDLAVRAFARVIDNGRMLRTFVQT